MTSRKRAGGLFWYLMGHDPDHHPIAGIAKTAARATRMSLLDRINKEFKSRKPPIVWTDAILLEHIPAKDAATAEGLNVGDVAITKYEWRLTAPSAVRRGESFGAGVPTGVPKFFGEAIGASLGIVVNPKLMKPAIVVNYTMPRVAVYRMDRADYPYEGEGWYENGCFNDLAGETGDGGYYEEEYGGGYYEQRDGEEEESEYEGNRQGATPGHMWTCHESHCVRVHTAAGVTKDEKSKGWGVALYTGLLLGAHFNSVLEIDDDIANCISSGEVVGMRRPDAGRSDDAAAWWDRQNRRGLTERSVKTRRISSRKEVKIIVDTYSYDSAFDNGMVIATLGGAVERLEPEYLWQRTRDGELETDDISLGAILGLDVRDLPLDTMNLLGILAEKGGATAEQLDHLRLRWELGLDPNAAVRQLRLLPNPARRDAEVAVAEAQEARDRFGWSRWADDVD